MSSETRTIRPYRGVARLQQTLDRVLVEVGHDAIEAGGRLDLSSDRYLASSVAVRFAGDGIPLPDFQRRIAEGVVEAGIPVDEAEIVVMVSTSRLKVSEIVWRQSISEIERLEPVLVITEERRPVALCAPFGGTRIDVYVLLRRNRTPAPLRPWRKGTWLARATFEIVTDVGELGFTPIPLDDTIRERFGLPAGANRYVRVDSVFDQDIGSDDVELYVDKELLAQLALSPGSAAAKAFQRQLFLDTAEAIVLEAVRFPELLQESIGELAHTLVGRLVILVAGRVPDEDEHQREERQEAILSMLRTEPNKFVTNLDAVINVKDDLVATLKSP